MRRLLTALVLAGSLVVACGSGDEARPRETETASSERVERQTTVSQQQDETQAQQEQTEVQSQQEQTESVQQEQLPQEDQSETAAAQMQEEQPVAEEEQQTEPPQEESDEQQVVELPPDVVGVHKGVRSERHVLGEPDAPVEIRYFGDFT